LAHASRDFNKIYGVDIHKNFLMTRKFLSLNNVQNFELMNREEMRIWSEHPSSRAEIDFVYSFIVFQHFESISEVKFYLNCIDKILAYDGVAHIYYGKNKQDSVKATPNEHFRLRDCSLWIGPKIFDTMVKEQFEVILSKENLPLNPSTGHGESSQAMIAFRKKRGCSR